MKTWSNEENLKDTFVRTNSMFSVDGMFEEYPPEIREWLTGLYRLEGVPIQYILPDNRMLPSDGIRFFFMDSNWLMAMIDGATSIGRTTETDHAIDSSMKSTLGDSTAGKARLHRQRLMHENHRRDLDQLDSTLSRESVLSGFLMRSELVRYWKGIEVIGYELIPGGNGKERVLTILRMEKMTNQMLLCIFDGKVERVELLEPAEALHFGTKARDRKIRVRQARGDKVGEVIGDMVVPQTNDGRVEVTAFVTELQKKLKLPEGEHVTSTEVALQLICVADIGEFKRGD